MHLTGVRNHRDKRTQRKHCVLLSLWFSGAFSLLLYSMPATPRAAPAAERIVIVKADGLPFDVVDRLVRQRDPLTGKSLLPWIDHVFYNNGVRLSNFYTRGLSLSVPSWVILDTGQPSPIKGNLEFDRLTLAPYDYLNIFTFVLKNSTGRASDSPAAMLLDELGVPLISDAYPPAARSTAIQVVTRDLRPASWASSLKRILTFHSPKAWLDEWAIGIDAETVLFQAFVRELITKLMNPEIQYLDVLLPYFDHTAHLNRAPEAQLLAIQKIDDAVGRIWMAIQRSPHASRTVIVLVSDHGMNTASDVYSQGFSLVDFLTAPRGGGHHVLTNRHPQGAYSFKALSPAIPMVITSAESSLYLKGKSESYPTAALDADGNERASVYLRRSDLNLVQILWQQLIRRDLTPEIRSAVLREFFAVIDRNRSAWSALLNEMGTAGDVLALKTLLSLKPDNFDVSRYKEEDLIPRRMFGEANSIHELQNYVVGLGPNGLVLHPDGSLNLDASIVHLNYFSQLRDVRSKNNVQAALSSRPVDFIAVRVPVDLAGAKLGNQEELTDAIFLFRDPKNQALILARRSDDQVQLKYLPVESLTQDVDGSFHFSPAEWKNDLPLHVWRDLPFRVDQRNAWLEQWHTEREWLEALHASEYSNAVVGLYEEFSTPMQNRKRELARADFVVFANDHWNFNYRGFNPGGNHSAFFRASTHATLMMAGGEESGIPKGRIIDRPYDGLSLAPTIFRMTGKTDVGAFPGPVIDELFVD
jgi:hypothetical protein